MRRDSDAGHARRSRRVAPQSRFSSGTNSSPRVVTRTPSTPSSAPSHAPVPTMSATAAGGRQSTPPCASPSSTWRAPKPRSSSPPRRRRPRRMALLRRRALGVGPLRGSRRPLQGRARRCHPIWRAATTAWRAPSPPAASCDEAMDEAQKALRIRRAISKSTTRSARSTSGCTSTKRPPARYSNYVNLLPNKDHSEKADWSRSEIKFLRSFGQRVPFEMDPAPTSSSTRSTSAWCNDKIVVRAKVNDGVVPGLRRRHRRGEHGAVAADRAAHRHHADHLHAQRRRRRRRPARAAARAHQYARTRAAQAAQRALPDQGSAAARPAGERGREPVAAGARLLDDHRLQDEQDDVRQASRAGAGRLRAADAPAPARDRPRHG